jgi:hypothetical protein
MPVALPELSNDPNCVSERGGIIGQSRADLIAVNVIGPSDREKVARHLALRDTALMWDHANMGARCWRVYIFPRPETSAATSNFRQ